MQGSLAEISSPHSRSNAEDEDYFFSRNSRQKSLDAKFKKTSTDSSNPFYQFDLKFDSLKNYVDSVTTAVNQHAALINKIKNELNNKMQEKSLSESIDRFANCINIKDSEPSIMITALRDNSPHKEGDIDLQASVNKFCGKLETIGNGFSRLSKLNQTLNDKITHIESGLGKKASMQDIKDSINKAKIEMKGEIENSVKAVDGRLKEVEKKYLEKVEQLENKLSQLEKEKISVRSPEESPTGVVKKVNLPSAMKDIEDRLIKEINKTAAASKASISETNTKLKGIEDNVNRRMLELNRTIDDIRNKSPSKQPSEFELIYKELKNYTAKEANELKSHVEASLQEFSQQFAILNVNISNLAKSDEIPKPDKVETRGSVSALDLERIAEIEKNTLDAKTGIIKMSEQIKSIQEILKEKVEYTDLNEQLKAKTDRSEFLNIVGMLEGVEKQEKLLKAVEDLQQKTDKVNLNCDRKIAKLKKEFDIDSLMKQFKNKADDGTVKETFSVVDAKINKIHDSFLSLKIEFERMADSVARPPMTTSLRNTDAPFITMKSILPKACLSCGHSSNSTQPHTHFSKRSDKAPLKERADRPETAMNLKSKVLTGTLNSINNNHLTLQGFGPMNHRFEGRHDSLK